MKVYRPDFLYAQGRWVAGGELCVGPDGTVRAGLPGGGAEQVRLQGRALLPGLVNAHSHAFQRVLRGRTEFLARGDDFWAWRELMYRAASSLNPEQVYAASLAAFVEMAQAGVTTVGEFHYLHHQADGRPYDDVHELSRAVVRAARDAGLRIVLLRVAYARAGFQVEPNLRQARFIEPDVETYLKRVDELRFDDPLVSVGYAPHSVRAVPREWLEAIARAGAGRVVHVHVAEQPAELRACAAEHGLHPVELLDEVGLLPRAVAVHAIHLEPRHFAKLKRVCACPSTEANVGDGVVAADALIRAGCSVSLGSDSQARIDLLEEARRLEEHLRLVRGRRAVLDPGAGVADGLAARLVGCATFSGAAALGLETGSLAPGEPADFFTVRADSLPAVVFGAERPVDVAVNGRLIVRDGAHALAGPAAAGLRSVVAQLV